MTEDTIVFHVNGIRTNIPHIIFFEGMSQHLQFSLSKWKYGNMQGEGRFTTQATSSGRICGARNPKPGQHREDPATDLFRSLGNRSQRRRRRKSGSIQLNVSIEYMKPKPV
jgi:hypothetical protein